MTVLLVMITFDVSCSHWGRRKGSSRGHEMLHVHTASLFQTGSTSLSGPFSSESADWLTLFGLPGWGFLMCVEWFASPWKQMDGGELGIGFYCLASLLPLLPCRSLYFCHTGLDSLDLVMSAFIHVGWLSLPNSFQWFFFYFIIIVFSGLLNKWFGEN